MGATLRRLGGQQVVPIVRCPGQVEKGSVLGRADGAKIEAAFQRSIVLETLTVVDLELADYGRIAELVVTYADFTYADFRSSRAGGV